jgi:hypothetical protein
MRATAYPELIDPMGWSVREDTERPRVEFAERIMSVPLGGTQAERFVRLHECAHVAWTPRNKAPSKTAARLGVPEVLLQCAEDARMALMLRRAARPYGRPYVTRGQRIIAEALDRGGLSRARLESLAASVIAHAKTGDPTALAQVASALVASHWTGDYAAIRDALHRASAEQHDKLLAHERENVDYVLHQGHVIATDAVYGALGRYEPHRRSSPPFKATERLAVALAEALRLAPPTSWAQRGMRLNAAGDGLEPTGDVHDETLERGARTESKFDTDGGAEWGRMKQAKLPLTQPLRGAVAAKRTAALAGVIPRRIDRWFADKKVFDQSRRALGGTVLLDASGSMSLPHSEVAALAAQSPNMSVAMYSGNGPSGTLTTIADKGRCATESAIAAAREMAGYSNIVDGPALRWLGKQAGPRIWVSDAEVFGACDVCSRSLREDVARICRSAGIIRVPTVGAAVRAYSLLRRSRGRITPGNVAALNKLTNEGYS